MVKENNLPKVFTAGYRSRDSNLGSLSQVSTFLTTILYCIVIYKMNKALTCLPFRGVYIPAICLYDFVFAEPCAIPTHL